MRAAPRGWPRACWSCSGSRSWRGARLQRRRPAGARRLECHVLGRKRFVRGSQGVRFEARAAARRYDAVIVPPLWGATREELFARLDGFGAEHAPLRALARRSAILASACSGAVLLAGAGLLEGRRATTCWWLADWFGACFAGVELVLDRVLLADGDAGRPPPGPPTCTSGWSWCARSRARRWRRARRARCWSSGAAARSRPSFRRPLPRDALDEVTRRALRYLDEHLATPLSISRPCRAIGVHEPTLARRFQAAVGLSSLAYLQSRRVARARQLLESSALPFEEIVARCGYEDAPSFRKLFTRQVGMTPREYRSRFTSEAPGRGAVARVARNARRARRRASRRCRRRCAPGPAGRRARRWRARGCRAPRAYRRCAARPGSARTAGGWPRSTSGR